MKAILYFIPALSGETPQFHKEVDLDFVPPVGMDIFDKSMGSRVKGTSYDLTKRLLLVWLQDGGCRKSLPLDLEAAGWVMGPPKD
jgi:hypothetical protein